MQARISMRYSMSANACNTSWRRDCTLNGILRSSHARRRRAGRNAFHGSFPECQAARDVWGESGDCCIKGAVELICCYILAMYVYGLQELVTHGVRRPAH